jgi:hypothetical protein
MSYKGTKLSEKTKKKISMSHKGKKKPWAGIYIHKPHTKEHTEKIRKHLIGRPVSSETRNKIRESLFGHLVSEKTREKISINRKGKLCGIDHPNWQGGKSFEPYSNDWTETLKRSIRERDRYTCRLCGIPQGEIAHDYSKECILS